MNPLRAEGTLTRQCAGGGDTAAAAAADKRVGRRPVDEDDEHAHMHVTVTIQACAHGARDTAVASPQRNPVSLSSFILSVALCPPYRFCELDVLCALVTKIGLMSNALVQIFAHKTDAPEPGVWALYHRLAFNSKLPNSTGDAVSGQNATTRQYDAGVHGGGVLGDAGGVRNLRHGKKGWERRSSVDDTLWVWGLGEDDAGGVWRESDGDGCAVVESLKLADIGVTQVSLRLLRVSVSGDELPVSVCGAVWCSGALCLAMCLVRRRPLISAFSVPLCGSVGVCC